MDAQTILTLIQVLLVTILLLVGYNMYLVFKLKDIDPFRNWDPQALNGGMFLVFLVVGFGAAIASSIAWDDTFAMVHDAASEHGVYIDGMFWRTMIVSVLVVMVTVALLFYFSWRYRMRPGNKALYYPHNNRLEVIWTVVPAIVMTLLIADGVRNWHNIMDPDEEMRETAMNIEFYGRQFDWTIRYPGDDAELGQTHVKYIDAATSNQLGFNFDDQRTHDDIVVTEVHLIKDVPVHMHIKSQDVLHSATLMHFRVKMDAVPGMPTNFWFTPSVSTTEMREIKGDPDFNYEMSCQQICGGAHWNMRRVVIVHDTKEEYDEWLSQQRPFYAQYKELNGLVPTDDSIPVADSTETPVVVPDAEPATAEKETQTDPVVAVVE